jgi:2-isopropylmalate synthase
MLAGAERVEGTLFGNGERTGNVDLVTLGLNLFTQGVSPGLDFSNLSSIRRVYERTTGMRVHERSPYAGDLVFAAFSGTHQDAINKGLEYRRAHKMTRWDVPYLPIDPHDVGRDYEPIIRINSLSGKGGAAFVLSDSFGYQLPRVMYTEFGALVKAEADQIGEELTSEQVMRLFIREYVNIIEPYRLIEHEIKESGRHGRSIVRFTGALQHGGEEVMISGEGNGPIDAFFGALKQAGVDQFIFASYHEHAISSGSDAKAVAYIELKYHGRSAFGVGIETNVTIASIKGVLSAVNRAISIDRD